MKKCCCDTSFLNDKTVIDALQEEMEKRGFLTEQCIVDISKNLHIPVAQVYGVATFYSQFSFKPTAKNLIEICLGTACFILGSQVILETLKKHFNTEEFENTKDNNFCVATVRCLGCCGDAPVVRVNGEVYKKMTPDKILKVVEEMEKKC